jgi:hypothetical protein
MATSGKITPKVEKAFLLALSENPNVSIAAKITKVSRNSWYERRKRNETFSKAWDKAEDMGIDALIDKVRGCAMGDEPDMSKTRLTAAFFLIKAKRPEYRDKYDVNMAGDLTVKVMKFADGGDNSK